MQTVLTATADQAARETHFVKRRSKLAGTTFVQTLVFGWWDDPAATYEQLAQTAALRVPMTAQRLDQRFTPEAAACLQQTLEQAARHVTAADPVMTPLSQRFNGVCLQDDTTITLPDALAALWPSCGESSAEGTRAALKAQVRFNLTDGQLIHLDLQAGRAQEKCAPTQMAALPVGALRIANLGYLSSPVLAEYDRQGVFWLTRYQAHLLLFEEDGLSLDFLSVLPTTEQTALDRRVQVSEQRLPCWLVSVRVPPPVSTTR